MNLRVIFYSFFLLFICFACGPNKQESITEKEKNADSIVLPAASIKNSLQDFDKNYTGKIENKYAITMHLIKVGNELTGTYKYTSQTKELKLKGNLFENGNFEMNEFSSETNISGVFRGKFEGEKITGYWEKPDGSKKMNFELLEEKNSELQTGSTSITGTFVDANGTVIEIKQNGDGDIDFKINGVLAAKCEGNELSGIAKERYVTEVEGVRNESLWYEFDGENECHIEFDIAKDGSLNVTESNCSTYSGKSCDDWAGVYKRK